MEETDIIIYVLCLLITINSDVLLYIYIVQS
jgi:hypothetical protein